MTTFQSAWRKWKVTWRYPKMTFRGIILRWSSIIISIKRLSGMIVRWSSIIKCIKRLPSIIICIKRWSGVILNEKDSSNRTKKILLGILVLDPMSIGLLGLKLIWHRIQYQYRWVRKARSKVEKMRRRLHNIRKRSKLGDHYWLLLANQCL